MADDLFEGVLGGDEDRSESAVPEAAAGAEAFAAAIAAIASRQDPGVARKTEAFLDKQAHLLDLQAQHLKDEHTSRLTHLRLTVGAAKRKRYADYMRNGLYTCIALLALGVVIAAVRMTVEAMSDHSLVVEDFTVPSDFAARGITSQALAEDLASRVAAIRAVANSHSPDYSREVRADQGGMLKVQIPETGISVDELERFLHRWLGHQTIVSGELREGPGGAISLVLHIAGTDPISVRGSSADLDGLMQTAAEKAFEIFDPYNDAIYLAVTGHPDEAYDAIERYVHGPRLSAMPRREQAAAYALIALSPDVRRDLSSALVVTDIDPRVATGWALAASTSSILGHDAAAVDFSRQALGTKRRDQPASEQDSYSELITVAHATIDRALGDFAALRSDYEAQLRGYRPVADQYAYYAQVAALLHDETTARQDLAVALVGGSPDSTVLQARWGVSSAAGDWVQALDAAKALVPQEKAQVPESSVQNLSGSLETQVATEYRPLLAYAEAMTGDTTSATALISQTPTDCYLCVRTRAKIAAAAAAAAAAGGDPASAAANGATADRWFAEAVRQAPDLPMAYYEWGEALLARGDLAGAARELSVAHEKGPHFADPLKDWGDVLAKQGHWSDALAKYDEALKYAPNWAALKQARRVAAKKS